MLRRQTHLVLRLRFYCRLVVTKTKVAILRPILLVSRAVVLTVEPIHAHRIQDVSNSEILAHTGLFAAVIRRLEPPPYGGGFHNETAINLDKEPYIVALQYCSFNIGLVDILSGHIIVRFGLYVFGGCFKVCVY